MPRAQRLLALLELLRVHRYPVRGAALADQLGVSVRTLYRDIATLQAEGARIEGAPGIGYLLRPGFTLPPLTFTEDELEALVLGARWVVDRGDAPLGEAARHALAKIRAVLPTERRARLDETGLVVGPRRVRRTAPSTADTATADAVPSDATPAVATAAGGTGADAAVDAAVDARGGAVQAAIRRAIRAERTLTVTYRDLQGRESVRTLWPIALAYFDRAHVVVAWCELRGGFRHFRTDRIVALAPGAGRYPRRRHVLLAEWQAAERIPARVTDGV